MNLRARAKYSVPATYKNFELIRIRGRVFGVHQSLDPRGVMHTGRLFDHPAILSAGTVAEVQQLIDQCDERTLVPEVIDRFGDFNLVRLAGNLYGVPREAGPADLHLPDERRRVGAWAVASRDELRQTIQHREESAEVEFAGWLPVYETAGNCGKHPQFAHAGEPPPGYRFTCSAPPPPRRQPRWDRFFAHAYDYFCKPFRGLAAGLRVLGSFVRPRPGITVRARVRVFFAMMRLVFTLLHRGCRPLAIVKFLHTRQLQSQLLLGTGEGPVFLTSMPFTYGQRPWVIEIEDPTTLFFPMIQNGQTCSVDIRSVPCFPIIKAMLESDECKAILTHMKSTAEMLPTLFQSEVIARKVIAAPLGVKLPARWQHHEAHSPDEPIDLLFINSWCQVPENFFVRGGLDVLEAFAILHERYPQLRLTMRTNLPALDDHFRRIIEEGWVRVIDRFMTAEEMADLHASSHIFLLPAARIHVVSLLQAMSYGLAVVASDGWGIEEYLDDERNGLVVEGRYGKTSWADTESGLLREDYEAMYTADPEIVDGLVEAVSRLVEDAQLRRRLGRAARRDIETRFTVARWNQGLQEALAQAVPATKMDVLEPAVRVGQFSGFSGRG
jgi:glycosyltransferase involved in cell wall biosynthesis